MKERDIIIAGLKIVGFFILIQGIFNLFSEVIPFIVQYNCIPEMVSAMDLTEGMSDAEKLRMAENAKGLAVVPIASKLTTSALRIILGLYLCRGGKLIAKFLTKPNKS